LSLTNKKSTASATEAKVAARYGSGAAPTQRAQAIVIVELFDIGDAPRLEEALAIRMRVFVEEQSVPLDLEIDEHDRDDPAARHALVRVAGRAVATGRYYLLDADAVQIGRLAVLAGWRGQGVGARLLDALLDEARRGGFGRASLDAQTQALDFYRKAGFAEEGETFFDAGILHQRMTRTLSGPSRIVV
jgi:predicted GNAT family N-acyltransferase